MPAGSKRKAPESLVDTSTNLQDSPESRDDTSVNQDSTASPVSSTRRSTRNIERNNTVQSNSSKEAEEDDNADELSEPPSDSSSDSENSDFEETERQTRTPQSTTKRATVSSTSAVDADGFKIPVIKQARSRGPKPRVAVDPSDIGDDLWAAVQHPNISIASLMSDWLSSYSSGGNGAQGELTEAKGEALLRLVNMIIKATGCPGSLNKQQFEDQDSVADWLEELQGHFDPNASPDIGLFSGKATTTKRHPKNKIKKAFLEFFDKLFASIKSEVLFDEVLVDVLSNWVVAMSSSAFRPFRITAATLSLHILTILCGIASDLNTEHNMLSRQLSTEVKKSGSTKLNKNERVRTLDLRVRKCHDRKVACEGLINGLFDSVFVHRYRDIEPSIRQQCITSLGTWIARYPDHFLEATYLRYIGWMLSDKNPAVRTQAINSLLTLYQDDRYASGLRSFTERFKPRLLELAMEEVDETVKSTALSLCNRVATYGLFEDDDRLNLCVMALSNSSKIRHDIAPLVKQVFEEDFLEEAVSHAQQVFASSTSPYEIDDSEAEKFVSFKALAKFMIRVSKRCDNLVKGENEINPGESDEENDESDELPKGAVGQMKEENGGHVAAFVDGLWSELELIQEYSSLATFLSTDFTCPDTESQPATQSDSVLSLSPAEEKTLLTLLKFQVKKLTSAEPLFPGAAMVTSAKSTRKRHEVDYVETKQEVSRLFITPPEVKSRGKGLKNGTGSLIKELFMKYSSVDEMVVDICEIMVMMDAGMWVDMRLSKPLQNLLGDINRIFLNRQSMTLLSAITRLYSFYQSHPLLNTIVSPKQSELVDSVVLNLRAAIENIMAAGTLFDESDEMTGLNCWLKRCESACTNWDICDVMEGGVGKLLLKVGEKLRIDGVGLEAITHLISSMNLYSMWKLSSVARLRPKSSSKSKKSRTRSTQGDEKEDLLTDNDNENQVEKEVPSLSVSEVELLLEMKNFVMDYLRDMLIIAPNDLNESLDTIFEAIAEYILVASNGATMIQDERLQKFRFILTGEDQTRIAKFVESRLKEANAIPSNLVTAYAKLLAGSVVDMSYAIVVLPLYHFDSSTPSSKVTDLVVKYLVEGWKVQSIDSEENKEIAEEEAEKMMEVYLNSLKKSFDRYFHSSQPSSTVPTPTIQLAKLFVHTAKSQISSQKNSTNAPLRGQLKELQKYASTWIIEKFDSMNQTSSGSERKTKIEKLSKFWAVVKEFVTVLDERGAKELVEHIDSSVKECQYELSDLGHEAESYFSSLVKKSGSKTGYPVAAKKARGQKAKSSEDAASDIENTPLSKRKPTGRRRASAVANGQSVQAEDDAELQPASKKRRTSNVGSIDAEQKSIPRGRGRKSENKTRAQVDSDEDVESQETNSRSQTDSPTAASASPDVSSESLENSDAESQENEENPFSTSKANINKKRGFDDEGTENDENRVKEVANQNKGKGKDKVKGKPQISRSMTTESQESEVANSPVVKRARRRY